MGYLLGEISDVFACIGGKADDHIQNLRGLCLDHSSEVRDEGEEQPESGNFIPSLFGGVVFIQKLIEVEHRFVGVDSLEQAGAEVGLSDLFLLVDLADLFENVFDLEFWFSEEGHQIRDAFGDSFLVGNVSFDEDIRNPLFDHLEAALVFQVGCQISQKQDI